ncbi:uncharacterized protein LOC135108576 [Scylla paramamosain]|uniref:uncharacterized protein LOC135108576 n=1 Tax=Scylla paramamosain TaxID=85552 RepID=UPI0030827311
MRIRLSNKRSYQSYSKGNTTVSNKTVVDADQNCLPKDTSIISCLTHRFGIDISVGNNRQSVDCQEETVHEVQGAEGFLQLEGEKKHGSWDEADSTSMQDIAKHSDTSTPNRPRRQRHGPSSTCSSATITPKNTSGTTRRSRVPHYPASWLEGLPLPASGNNTTRRTSKKTDTHEAKFKIPEAVLSCASLTKKTSRKSKKILIDSEVENPDAGETDMINDKEEYETRYDLCASFTDGMDDLTIPRDTEVALEVLPEMDSSSVTETDMNVLESDDQQCVGDIQYGTDTDRLNDIPPNNEDKGDSLVISENVLKNNKHHCGWRFSICHSSRLVERSATP